jgi:hypothetical protein
MSAALLAGNQGHPRGGAKRPESSHGRYEDVGTDGITAMDEKVTPAQGRRKASFTYFSKIWANSKLAVPRR